MRKILISAALFAVLSVVNGSASIEQCQKNCGLELGSCITKTQDMEQCLEKSADCALVCFNSLAEIMQVKTTTPKKSSSHHHHHQHGQEGSDPDVSANGDIGICQKNCGIDYGKCMIQTFNLAKCSQDEACCALDCLKGKPFVAKYDAPIVKKIHNVEGTQEICQKNCGIDYGKCMIQTFNFAQCSKDEACCALECLKGIKVKGLDTVQSSAMETCQQNCATDIAKCLLQKFDMSTCMQDTASCALDCIKGVAVSHKSANPQVKSIKCTACKFIAGKVEGIVSQFGCGLADTSIRTACEAGFGGPEDPLTDICTAGFMAACPKIESLLKDNAFTTEKACQAVHLC